MNITYYLMTYLSGIINCTLLQFEYSLEPYPNMLYVDVPGCILHLLTVLPTQYILPLPQGVDKHVS
jgi:hypothetical protein